MVSAVDLCEMGTSDDWSEADALIEWYQDHLDLELFLIAMDNEIAMMEVAEAMNQ